MPEKSQKRKLRSDPSSSLENVESTSQASDENTCLTDQDFSDISNKIENRLSKRLRDAEFGQREILKLIENLAAKVDGLSNSATEPSGSVLRHDIEPESIGNSEPIGNLVNVSSNTIKIIARALQLLQRLFFTKFPSILPNLLLYLVSCLEFHLSLFESYPG